MYCTSIHKNDQMRITLPIKALKKPIYDMKKIKKELIYIQYYKKSKISISN